MTTIDHAAEARKLMDTVFEHYDTSEDVGAIVTMQAAQVHATLALVNEQRIANFIALWMGDSSLVDDANFDRVGDEIKKGLGL